MRKKQKLYKMTTLKYAIFCHKKRKNPETGLKAQEENNRSDLMNKYIKEGRGDER